MITATGRTPSITPTKLEGDRFPFSEFHRQSWANPLDLALTTLTTDTTDLDGDEVDDVLPGDPFLTVLNTRFLVRAEYIRVFNEVETLYNSSRVDHLAVLTGQPGIGARISVVCFCD